MQTGSCVSASVGRNILEQAKQPRLGEAWFGLWQGPSSERLVPFRRNIFGGSATELIFEARLLIIHHWEHKPQKKFGFPWSHGSVTKKGSWGFQRAFRHCILLLIGWLQQGAGSGCFLALPNGGASIYFQGVALEWCQSQFFTLLVSSTRMHLSLLAPNLSLWKLSLLNGLHLEGFTPDSYVLLDTYSCLLVFQHFVASWQLAFVSQAGLCVAAPKIALDGGLFTFHTDDSRVHSLCCFPRLLLWCFWFKL